MSDTGDIYKGMRESDKKARHERLAATDDAGWDKQDQFRWARMVMGRKFVYWPSTRRFYWKGKYFHGDANAYIKAIYDRRANEFARDEAIANGVFRNG